jgi:cyanophycin synthetase
VAVKGVVNQNRATENESVLSAVHPAVIETGRRAAGALGVELAGVDVMTPDFGEPLEQAGGVVIEVNTTPALHHHYLVRSPDAAVPVADRILEGLLR